MQLQIAFFMIGFLEQDVGSDSGFLQQAVVIHCRGSNIDIYPADCSVFMLDIVNGVDGIQIVIHGVVNRIFTGFQRQTLVSHILQCNDFPFDIFLG